MDGVVMSMVNSVSRPKLVKHTQYANSSTPLGIEMYETANYPSKVSSEKLNGKSIIEFDIADNVAVFLTGEYFIVPSQ